jgi:hypothetical protein
LTTPSSGNAGSPQNNNGQARATTHNAVSMTLIAVGMSTSHAAQSLYRRSIEHWAGRNAAYVNGLTETANIASAHVLDRSGNPAV